MFFVSSNFFQSPNLHTYTNTHFSLLHRYHHHLRTIIEQLNHLKRGRELTISPNHGTPHRSWPTDNLFQKVGTILDEGEETLERDEHDPPPCAEPGYRPCDEDEEEEPEDVVENIGCHG
mmetsp:Transcript_7422/g.16831  ORF Transcript_7422/g.16831 Transcript_7422/m.16831 type:complete len:119 (-) Transcript_7422:38-394(-)